MLHSPKLWRGGTDRLLCNNSRNNDNNLTNRGNNNNNNKCRDRNNNYNNSINCGSNSMNRCDTSTRSWITGLVSE